MIVDQQIFDHRKVMLTTYFCVACLALVSVLIIVIVMFGNGSARH